MQTSFFFLIVWSSGDPDNTAKSQVTNKRHISICSLGQNSKGYENEMKPQKIFTREQRKLLSIKGKAGLYRSPFDYKTFNQRYIGPVRLAES